MQRLPPMLFLAACLGLATSDVSADLITKSLLWTGSNGYTVSGTFTYDAAYAIIQADYDGSNNGLDYLHVEVFNPSSALLFSVTDVQGGVILPSSYLRFQFVPSTQLFGDAFQFGEYTGEAGKYLLEGYIGTGSNLRDSNLTAISSLNPASITVSAVPDAPEIDPAAMGSVLALIGGGLGLLERRRRRA